MRTISNQSRLQEPSGKMIVFFITYFGGRRCGHLVGKNAPNGFELEFGSDAGDWGIEPIAAAINGFNYFYLAS